MIIELLTALLYAGLPVAFISFGMIYWAQKKGYPIVKESDDVSEDLTEELTEELTEDLDDITNDPNITKSGKQSKNKHIVFDKWTTFGGGYYGIMALVTYAHVELLELWQAFSAFESIQHFINQLSLGFFIGLIIEAIKNLVTAFIWFTYWDEFLPINSPWLWLGASYAGYYAGEKLMEYRLNTDLTQGPK
jgi:hypothetical protein